MPIQGAEANSDLPAGMSLPLRPKEEEDHRYGRDGHDDTKDTVAHSPACSIDDAGRNLRCDPRGDNVPGACDRVSKSSPLQGRNVSQDDSGD